MKKAKQLPSRSFLNLLFPFIYPKGGIMNLKENQDLQPFVAKPGETL